MPHLVALEKRLGEIVSSSDYIRELIILLSQIDNQHKDNLLIIFKFLNKRNESFIISHQDDFIKIKTEYYEKLVAGIKDCEFKVDLSRSTFFSSDNIIAVTKHIELLKNFVSLTLDEQNNVIKITKLICYHQTENVTDRENILHDNYNLYTQLIEKIKRLEK